MRLPRLLLEEPDVEKGSNQEALQLRFGVGGHTQDVLIIVPFAPHKIVGVNALQRRIRLGIRGMIITTRLTYRLFLMWSLAFHLYSTPLYLNLRDLQEA